MDWNWIYWALGFAAIGLAAFELAPKSWRTIFMNTALVGAAGLAEVIAPFVGIPNLSQVIGPDGMVALIAVNNLLGMLARKRTNSPLGQAGAISPADPDEFGER